MENKPQLSESSGTDSAVSPTATVDVSQLPPEAERTNHKLPVLGFVGLAVFNLIAIGTGYLILSRAWKTAHIPVASNSLAPAQNIAGSQQPTTQPSQVASYTSKKFKLAFDYRADWEVTEDEYSLTIDSPLFTFTEQTHDDNGKKISQKVRGVFKIYVTKDSSNTIGEIAAKNSDLIQHSIPLNGRKSSYVSYLGHADIFSNLTFSGGTQFKKGQTVSLYDTSQKQLNPIFSTPISMVGGYFDLDAPKQGLTFEDMLVTDFDKTDYFQQAVDIIKTLHSV